MQKGTADFYCGAHKIRLETCFVVGADIARVLQKPPLQIIKKQKIVNRTNKCL